jgi:chitinase
MTRLQICFIFFALAIFFAVPLKAQLKVVGYVTNDQLAVVDYRKITHLNVAFENPDSSGNMSHSPANDIYIQKSHEAGKKVLISIAGGGASHNPAMQQLYFNLISDTNRRMFVEKLVAYVNARGFDGLDVDLEGPSINADYAKFISDLHAVLKPRGKLLTAALSHMNGADKVPDETLQLFDFINIMAYDATGPWRPEIAGQHSSFEFAKTSLDYWIGRGLPKNKAILGVPFYGYGFGDDFNQGMGFGEIIAKYPAAENRDISGNTIYYNGIPTIRQKTNYVVDGGYGGIMIWQLGHDAIGPLSLLTAIHQVINKIPKTDDQSEPGVSVYPVPVDSTLSLKALGYKNGKIKLTDTSGKQHRVIRVNDDVIDVASLLPGFYVIRFSNGRKSLATKFLKK